ncbi:multidrug effflux MFS transporter [Shewanella sp. H8]|uniref:multidrug effflux MFS transporter n=1 Tax=Shewanella sp. H8 TaxID=3342676 RepID=UPI003315A238
MNVKQSFLGSSGTLFFLVIVSAFPPLTTDLYLPALPTMVEMLNTTQTMVNLTLSVYFVMYALGLLFWGPLSEKFGRKPIMLLGLVIYVMASLLCAMANNIEMLIGARLVQAFGGSAVTVVATAIVKDLYTGREREKIMATIMSLVIIAPMVAPVLGAFLLKIGSWHMMFYALAIFGAISTLLTLFYRETLQQRYTGSVLRSWGRIAVVTKNPRFIVLLVIFTIPPMTLMAFLAAGSYIYIDGFGLSEQMFSYAFAFNALVASFGPSIYMKFSRSIAVHKIITTSFIIMMVLGVLTYTIGHLSPWLFACLVAPATLMMLITRVPGINLMLDQQSSDTGSAVAVIQFCSMMAGAIGMTLVSLRPNDLIHNLGIIQFSVGAIVSVLWFMVKKRPFVVDNIPKQQDDI